MANITDVIIHLTKEYESAVNKQFVTKPLSYALYRTWKWCDEKEQARKIEYADESGLEYADMPTVP